MIPTMLKQCFKKCDIHVDTMKQKIHSLHIDKLLLAFGVQSLWSPFGVYSSTYSWQSCGFFLVEDLYPSSHDLWPTHSMVLKWYSLNGKWTIWTVSRYKHPKRPITCNDCNRFFHLSCVDLSRCQADSFTIWNCDSCHEQRDSTPVSQNDNDSHKSFSNK